MDTSMYLPALHMLRYMEIFRVYPVALLMLRYMEISNDVHSCTIHVKGTWKFPCTFTLNTKFSMYPPAFTLRAESPSIFLDKLSRKIEGDSARRVSFILRQMEISMYLK